jgi:hypothetical protein
MLALALILFAQTPVSTRANPTYLYPPNTTYTIRAGQVITSAEPTSMCYLDEQGRPVCQNLPKPAAQSNCQPVMYQQPARYYRPFVWQVYGSGR